MHYLDRASVPEPQCLQAFSHTTHIWDDVGSQCKTAIRESLRAMQGPRCAYCEASVEFSDRHIEHFRRKGGNGQFRNLTFDWSNLFLSCDGPRHCGHYKDNPRTGPGPYSPSDLVKPDVEEPDNFLYFYSNGRVEPRSGTLEAIAKRANETIRVFNLDAGQLRHPRERAVAKYIAHLDRDRAELATWSDADRRAYFDSEIAETADRPFATAIRHYLERLK